LDTDCNTATTRLGFVFVGFEGVSDGVGVYPIRETELVEINLEYLLGICSLTRVQIGQTHIRMGSYAPLELMK
jgi:hypothetical protein